MATISGTDRLRPASDGASVAGADTTASDKICPAASRGRSACLLGFGLYLAWSTLIAPFEQSYGVEGFSSSIARLYLISAITALALVSSALYAHRTHRSPWSIGVLVVCGAMATCAPAFDLVGLALPAGGFAFDVCAIVLRSVADAGLFLMWNAQLAGHKAKVAWVAYATCMVLSPLVCLVVTALGQWAITVAVFVLPALSCAALVGCRSLPRDESAREEGVTWKFPWRPVVLMAAFTFASSVGQHFAGSTQLADQVGQFVMCATVLAAALVAFDKFGASALYKVCPALLVTGLLLCGVQAMPTDHGLRSFLVSAGYAGFTLYTYLVLNAVCYRFGAPSEWLFGITRAVCYLAVIPGSILGDWMHGVAAVSAGPQGLAGEWGLVSAALTLVAALLVLLSMLLMTDKTSAETWGIRGVRAVSHDERTGFAASETDYLEDRVYRCALMARHYGLTHREEEVLSLISQGNSLQQIEATLCIAHGTMRVHVQHVYAKLGVHSFEEARRMVADWKP